TQVRPGHADYSGCVKYGFDDARNILERASARETAIRVAVGAVGKSYLKTLGIDIASRVISIGTAVDKREGYTFDEIKSNADKSEVRCLNAVAEKEMIALIDQAKENKDTLGGEVEIVVKGMPVGIGSHTYYDRKLDYALMGAVGSVQSVKSVAIGQDCSALFGSQAHDKMYLQNGKIVRKTNRAGGIEGGISNGEEIVIRAKLKPIPTVMAGLDTVDIVSKEQVKSSPERSDVCAVPAGAVVIENVVAFTLMQAINDTLGGDIISETVARMEKLREKRI
ncbi:MAG: chorismate synthase, partial [Clostridia bacterium]|nr:chorismate synthase [Clostridia bacterium]